jgi:hypothetical protein
MTNEEIILESTGMSEFMIMVKIAQLQVPSNKTTKICFKKIPWGQNGRFQSWC